MLAISRLVASSGAFGIVNHAGQDSGSIRFTPIVRSDGIYGRPANPLAFSGRPI